MNTFIFLLPSFHKAIDLRSHRVIVFIMNFFVPLFGSHIGLKPTH